MKTGDITATIRNWEFTDKALIETTRGNINLTFPQRFSGEVDLWSVHGKVDLDFPLEKLQNSTNFGPEPDNHLVGRSERVASCLRCLRTQETISLSKGKI